MNLHHLLAARRDAGRPVRVALIGAGKFGSMFLAQIPAVPGLEVAGIADLDPNRARAACRAVGWDDGRIAATPFVEDGLALICGDEVEVVVEATGNPAAGIAHCRAAIQAGKHVVMVNVEADVLAGPLLAEQARRAGVVYSLAYGDQPALTAELVDWARACGFRVVAVTPHPQESLIGYIYRLAAARRPMTPGAIAVECGDAQTAVKPSPAGHSGAARRDSRRAPRRSRAQQLGTVQPERGALPRPRARTSGSLNGSGGGSAQGAWPRRPTTAPSGTLSSRAPARS